MERFRTIIPTRMTIFVILLCLLIAVVNIRWVMLYRVGGGLDIDEAGYIGYAIMLERAWLGGGIGGWFHALSYPYGQAPFTMASASWLMAAAGSQSEWTAMLTNSILNALLVLAVYALGSRAYNRGVGAVAAVLVGATPYLIEFARNFNFATAAALFLIATLYCYERSDGLRRPAWALMLGICAGLMLLSRTMTLAFVPAMAVMFLIDSLVSRTPVPRLLVMLLLSLAAFLITCGPWFIINGETVFGYLLSFGYGQHATEYSSSDSAFSIENIIYRFNDIANNIKITHTLIFLLGFILVIFTIAIRGPIKNGRLTFEAKTLIFVCLSFLILLSSRNVGMGFSIPLLPPLTIAIVGAGASLIRPRLARTILVIVLVGCAGSVFALNADRRLCRLRAGAMTGAGITSLNVVDCGGTMERYIEGHSEGPFHDETVAEIGRSWRTLNEQLTQKLMTLPDADRGVLFATRHILLNVNTVNLDLIKSRGAFMAVQQIDPVNMGRTSADYEEWLKAPPASNACYVVAMNTIDGEVALAADPDNLRKAIVTLGYSEVDRLPTPTAGQYISIFHNPALACHTAS